MIAEGGVIHPIVVTKNTGLEVVVHHRMAIFKTRFDLEFFAKRFGIVQAIGLDFRIPGLFLLTISIVVFPTDHLRTQDVADVATVAVDAKIGIEFLAAGVQFELVIGIQVDKTSSAVGFIGGQDFGPGFLQGIR